MEISVKNHIDMLIFHTAVCDEPKQPLIRHACRKHACGDSHKCSSWRISVKNHIDMLIFHTAICAGASQIATDGRLRTRNCKQFL